MPVRHRSLNGTYNGTVEFSGSPLVGGGEPTQFYGTTFVKSSMDDLATRSYTPKECHHAKYQPSILDGCIKANAPWDTAMYGDWYWSGRLWGYPQYANISSAFSGVCHSSQFALNMSDYPNTNLPNPVPWNLLLSELASTVDGHMVSKTNVLENLATMGQTIKMVKNPLSSLQSLIKKTARTKRLSFSELAHASSSGWLEYRYGWNPLRYSFKALSEVWKKAEDHIRYLNSVRGKTCSRAQRREYKVSYPSSPTRTYWAQGLSNHGYMPVFGLEVQERSTVIAVSLDLDVAITTPVYSKMQYAIEYLHADSLFDVLWELTPYSFVVDWLINTDLLAASYLSTRLQAPDVHNVCYSQKESLTYRVLATSGLTNHCPGGYSRSNGSSSPAYLEGSIGKISTYSRYAGFPSGFDVPGLMGGVNTIHLLDGSALIINALPTINH